MRIEEPLVRPESTDHYPALGFEDAPLVRTGPAEMLEYDDILHLDEVLDYSPLPSSPDAFHSYDTGDVDMPFIEDSTEWSQRHPHTWFLGYEDGCLPRAHASRRPSAMDRLGPRRD
uniref:Uncharacterized protein n=1 Tax=Arundo donax TaxID=35708 RepID=A0A0A8ZYT4_ARUDO